MMGDDLDVLVVLVEPGFAGYVPKLPPDAPPVPHPRDGAMPGDRGPP
jgi:hypothetical protein